MIEFLAASPYFGIVLTLVMFLLAVAIHRRWKSPFTTPLFLGTVFVIFVLLATGIPYSAYNNGAKYLTYFMVPLTVCFAVPMYKQLPTFRRYALPILFSVLIGVACSVLSVIFVCMILLLGSDFYEILYRKVKRTT